MDEPVTLRDVALEAGVSIDTVSRVLNGKGKEKWPSAMRRAQEIRQIAERLNYRPNAAARAIRSSRTRMIGAIVRHNPQDPRIHSLSYETLVGINEGIEAAGYVLSVIRMDDVEFETAVGSRVFRERMLDGMVAIDGLPQHIVDRLEQLVPTCVWVNTNVWREQGCLRRDEVFVGQTIARAMVDLGYRRLVLVGGTRGTVPHYSHDERFAGVTQVARTVGASVERIRVPWADTFDSRVLPLDIFDPSVAIIAEGPSWAQWLSQLAAGLGKCAPYDFGLACCDESSEICRYWPGLGRVSFDHYRMGMQAAKMILQRVEHPTSVCLSQKFQGFWKPGNTAWGPSFRPVGHVD